MDYMTAAGLALLALGFGFAVYAVLDDLTWRSRRNPAWSEADEAQLLAEIEAMERDANERPALEVTTFRRDGRPVHTYPRAIPWGGLGRVLDSGWWELRDDASAYDWHYGHNQKGPWE